MANYNEKNSKNPNPNALLDSMYNRLRHTLFNEKLISSKLQTKQVSSVRRVNPKDYEIPNLMGENKMSKKIGSPSKCNQKYANTKCKLYFINILRRVFE